MNRHGHEIRACERCLEAAETTRDRRRADPSGLGPDSSREEIIADLRARTPITIASGDAETITVHEADHDAVTETDDGVLVDPSPSHHDRNGQEVNGGAP
ncbi:hypothetical protein BRD56_05305 [Thermoplasmatales archaeon SW_10_69_26]|nr:MAG: hypothetical protein BRD56_05305 [Thermoplasmatales archaeon SW_10_69_26]